MTDELLPYYHRELDFIRKMGAQFAEAHPKLAARLRLSGDRCEDPHVERLIEAFAYLNARIRHKLDDEFPEITDALLGVLYPHYLNPVPSMAIIQLALDPAQGKLTTGYTVPRGATVETEPIDGEPCRFVTCYPTTLWPVELTSASLTARPFRAPQTPTSSEAVAVLRLVLRPTNPEMGIAQLDLDSLRFFLSGQSQHVYPLYELIFNNTMQVVVAGAPDDPAPVVLDAECIRPVGFERDEGILPYSTRSFLGYRLLTEYFAFPEKFLFFDLAALRGRIPPRASDQLELYFYLAATSGDLEQNVSAESFRMGCTPMVNLYRKRAEPISLTHTEWEYRVVPDARRPMATEVYSIDRVTATSPEAEQFEFVPFYSFKHGAARREQVCFWSASRRPAVHRNGLVDHGTEVHLSVVDLDFNPGQSADWTLDVETTCLNRDLPHRLPFGGDQPRLQLSDGGPIARVACLTPPTPTLRPEQRQGAFWKLVSHLSLNHLSLGNGEPGTEALREILKLYDFTDSAETRSQIGGIVSVRSRRVVGRVGSGAESGFCRGVETTVEFDEDRYTGTGVYLFACVLERFLALYCSINSFSKLVVTTKQREGELSRWPPRAGEMALL